MTLGDLNIRMVLEIVEANKSAQQVDSNLKSVDSQSKKASQSVTDLGKTANKTSADIKDVATKSTQAAQEVSLLGETFSHLSTLLKATVILYAMDLIFSKVKDKQILGAKVEKGTISLGSQVKIMRRDENIGEGKVRELQQQKVATSEVDRGEFGTMIVANVEIAPGDTIESFIITEK